ncbi:MAG: hypothetical protein R3E01_24665 [Pirellulaceae bacterium]|nr:hypothetical protein [Planctomycetales bacterium]
MSYKRSSTRSSDTAKMPPEKAAPAKEVPDRERSQVSASEPERGGTAANGDVSDVSFAARPHDVHVQTWNHICRLVRDKRYAAAANSLAGLNRSPISQNALAVCLMRCNRADEALSVLRPLAMQTGGTWTRRDAPLPYKTNLATALLLKGLPSGCLSVLADINCPDDPRHIQMKNAVDRWVRTLSLWQKLNWYTGRIEPQNTTVPLDFEPGDFAWELAGSHPS